MTFKASSAAKGGNFPRLSAFSQPPPPVRTTVAECLSLRLAANRWVWLITLSPYFSVSLSSHDCVCLEIVRTDVSASVPLSATFILIQSRGLWCFVKLCQCCITIRDVLSDPVWFSFEQFLRTPVSVTLECLRETELSERFLLTQFPLKRRARAAG